MSPSAKVYPHKLQCQTQMHELEWSALQCESPATLLREREGGVPPFTVFAPAREATLTNIRDYNLNIL